MEKILSTSLKLNFTPSTLGCCGLCFNSTEIQQEFTYIAEKKGSGPTGYSLKESHSVRLLKTNL